MTSSPAIEQLRLLNYQDGEKVYYRAIADNKPRKLSAIFPAIPPELETLNKDGFNIYMVVNGGGDKDADVVACKAIFYEHDHIPKEDQPLLWQSLGLPEPTFQVDTGGKSVHSYWVFDSAIAVYLWRTLQTDLLNYSDGDRTIKNPSRVMRMAGFKHRGKPDKPGSGELASIVNKSGIKYSYEELRSVVPSTPAKPVKEKLVKEKPQKPSSSSISAQVSIAIPLEICLSLQSRSLLKGVTEGDRNCSGAALARDLIGVEEYFKSNGTLYIGDARSLFDDFCSRCSPSIDDAEAQTIWGSAETSFPEPSCPPDAIANILNAWYKEHDPDYVEPEEKRKVGYYSSIEEGLVRVYMVKNADGFGVKARIKVGNHLEAIAIVDNPEQNQSSIQLEFKTFQGTIRRVVILRSDLGGDGTAIVSSLLGLCYAFKRKQKAQLLDYLHGLGIGISKEYTITDVTGWVKNSFVMPHKTYGNTDIRFRDIEPSDDVLTEIKGTLDDWQTHVASKCISNSRPTFGFGVGFGSPLLEVVKIESGGFHLVGGTSQGKTTILKITASVTGEKQIPSWRATTNGLESVATAHNGCALMLDEIGQTEPREVGNAAYLLGNGQSKTRMTKRLTNQPSKKWKLIFLSSGEVGLAQYIAQAQIVIKGGQEVRMCDLPAVPKGSAFGVFETIHGADSSKQFAQDLEAATEKYGGTAIDAYLTRLVADRSSKFDSELTSRMVSLSHKLAEGTKNHAVSRVADRFAIVQIGLELAHSYGILPFGFEIKHIEWAVKKMFDDWLDSRGGDGSIEIKKACERIEHLITSNEHSDRLFDPTKPDGQIVRNLLGYKVFHAFDRDFIELLVPTSIFDKEYCQEVDKKALIAELQLRGWLKAPGLDEKPTATRNICGKKMRFYVFCINRLRDECFSAVPAVPAVPVVKNGSDSKSQPEPAGTEPGFRRVPAVPVNDKSVISKCDEEPILEVDDDGLATNF